MNGLDAPEERGLLIAMLADRLPELADIPRPSRPRSGMLEIVRACRQNPRGLPELADALNEYAPNSLPVLRIRELVDASQVLPVLSDAELRRVHSLLAGVRHLDVRDVLCAAAGGLTPLPDRPMSSFGEAFDFLAGANARADGLLPVMALVEQVAAALGESDNHRPIVAGLREWNDAQAIRLALDPQLRVLRAEIALDTASQPAPACLVIQLSPHGMSPDQYVLSHWRQIRPGPWRPERGEDQVVVLSAVETIVERLVNRAEEDWAGRTGKPELEFVLPMNLLNRPMEWLPMASHSSSDTPLCLSYPVVLRSMDRMRAAQYHRRWRNRWERMMGDSDIVCHWDTAGQRGHDPVRWMRALAGDEGLIAVALNTPPLPGPDGSQESLAAALRAGVPLAIWDRRTEAPSEFRKRAKRLMRGKPMDLPERVQTLRNEAATAAAGQRDSHAGRHLAFLFDDPNRIVDWSEPGVPGPGSASGGYHDEGDA